jgi:hypothetical protein
VEVFVPMTMPPRRTTVPFMIRAPRTCPSKWWKVKSAACTGMVRGTGTGTGGGEGQSAAVAVVHSFQHLCQHQHSPVRSTPAPPPTSCLATARRGRRSPTTRSTRPGSRARVEARRARNLTHAAACSISENRPSAALTDGSRTLTWALLAYLALLGLTGLTYLGLGGQRS